MRVSTTSGLVGADASTWPPYVHLRTSIWSPLDNEHGVLMPSCMHAVEVRAERALASADLDAHQYDRGYMERLRTMSDEYDVPGGSNIDTAVRIASWLGVRGS